MFWLFFSNKEPNQSKLLRDGWTILQISNTLTKLADIAGGNLSEKKGNSVDSGCREFSDDENDSQSVWDHINLQWIKLLKWNNIFERSNCIGTL